MKKTFLVIISAVILGYLCSIYVIGQYNNSEVLAQEEKIYFLQIAAYNKKESSKDEFNDIDNKLLIKKDDKYYLYIGITSSKDIALRIKKIYKDKNINVYIKESNILNNDFYNELKQYDILIENSKDNDEIASILKTILATYENYVLEN